MKNLFFNILLPIIGVLIGILFWYSLFYWIMFNKTPNSIKKQNKKELVKDIHYKLNVYNYDTLWIKYDTVISKHYSIQKPKEYEKNF